MGALTITDDDVAAEARRRGLDPDDPATDLRSIRRDIASEIVHAKKMSVRKQEPPMVVVTQVRRGDVILSTTEQTIPNT